MSKLSIIIFTLAAFAEVVWSANIFQAQGDRFTRSFNNNPESFDYKLTGGNDEHRFGVALKDNKIFHHTKTDEDGVRLGCYGHEIGAGKKFITHYVADGKGYRIVPYDKVVTVFPKDGGSRKASFIEAFGEEEVMNSNIRYLFPEGCRSPSVAPATIPKILKKDDVIEVPTTPTPTTTTTSTTAPVPIPRPAVFETEKPVCPETCCDDNRPEVILPDENSSFCHKSLSKIVIPINLGALKNIPYAQILEITNETDSVVMLLKLLRLIEMCKSYEN